MTVAILSSNIVVSSKHKEPPLFIIHSVEINDRLYENQLPLMCYVVPEESLCEWNGFELRLKLKKQAASLSWPCLLEDGVDRDIRWV